jgi:succinoglycan biosynthesis protein ExoU
MSPAADPDRRAPVLHPAAGVAVIIAAWRASATIGRAVASALAQPEAVEVVVVDDASGDDGATFAAAMAADDGTKRLTILQLTKNGGPSVARNAAIAASRAPWICVLDSDDFMEKGRLAALVALTPRGYDFIADDLLQAPENDLSNRRTLFFDAGAEPLDVTLPFFLKSNIQRAGRDRRELGFIKPLMRRDFLERHGIRYDEGMRLAEDYDLYVRALAAGARFRLIPAVGYISVIRPNSLSGSHGRKDLVACRDAEIRLEASGLFSDEELGYVRARRATMEHRIAWIDFVEALKAGNVFRASGFLLRSPKQTAYVVNALVRTAFDKLTGPRR